MGSRAVSLSGRPGVYAVLEAALPGHNPHNIGVLLIDSTSGRGWLKLRERYDDIADPGDAEIFEALESHLRDRLDSDGAEALPDDAEPDDAEPDGTGLDGTGLETGVAAVVPPDGLAAVSAG